MRRLAAFALVATATLCLFFLVGVPDADAGGCQNYTYHQTSYQPYSYQTYHQPTYHQPTYQYKTVAQEVLVPYPVKALISPDYYFAHQDSYAAQAAAHQGQLVADAAAFRALTLMVNSGMTGNLRNSARVGQQVPAPYDSRVPQTPQQPQGVRPAQPSAGVPAGLQAVVDASCAKCHSGQPNRLDLSNLAAVPRADRYDAWEQVNGGAMPKGGKPLNDVAEKLFREWAKAGKR